MSDVDRVVDTETNGDDQVVAGDSVYGDAPEVEEATNIDQGDDDTTNDDDGSTQVSNEEECGDEDTDEGEDDIPVDLLSNHFISLPGSVTIGPGKHSSTDV